MIVMNRSNFLKTAIVTGTILALPGLAGGYNPTRYPLISVADEGTVLDEPKAAKVRKLAEYAATDNSRKGLMVYNRDYFGFPPQIESTRPVVVVDGIRYSINVHNHDENQDCPIEDSMTIWMRPEGTTGRELVSEVYDAGLDGGCNGGFIAAGVNETGKKISFSDGRESIAEGSEHSARFQHLFDTAVDRLLAFYEQK